MNKLCKKILSFIIFFLVFSLNVYAEDNIYTFNYTGNYQTWIVPKTGIYRVELWGAQGGINNKGGYGGYTAGSIYLEKDLELYVYVGQSKSNTTTSTTFNGSIGTSGGTPGGGATDIRLDKGAWNNFNSLKSRIMVAGSGGSGSSGKAGAGGGLIGKAGGYNMPGTQTKGGTSYQNMYEHGGFGYGGGGCAGGSGYYGAGGAACSSGASGGSSFISGHNGCNAIKNTSTSTNIIHEGNSLHYSGYKFFDTIMIDGDGYNWTTSMAKESTGMPTHNGNGTMVGNAGNGYAKISLLKLAKIENIIVKDAEVIEDKSADLLYNVIIKDKEVKTNIQVNFSTEYNYVIGTGDVTLVANTTHFITTIDDAGNLSLITLNVYEETEPVTIDFKETTLDFDYKKYNYELEVGFDIKKLTPEITVPDGMNYEVINADNLKVGNNEVLVKIKNNVKEIVYTFNVTREKYVKVGVSESFKYTGAVQTYKVPADGYYIIELWGAAGTDKAYGGYTKGKIFLKEGTELHFYVGQQAVISSNATGFNSGTGGNTGYSGGGATDVRLVKNTDWKNFNSLKSRIMVAGGGGTSNGGTPGAAGGLAGYNGGGGKGGTQIIGGNGDSSSRNGQFGYASGGTAGGNGYYAGGGSGFTTGSGGGSSFISGHEGCNAISEASTVNNIIHTGSSVHYLNYVFTDTVMVDGQGYAWTNTKGTKTNMPTFEGTGTMVGNTTNGYAKITSTEILEESDNTNLEVITLTNNEGKSLKDIDGNDIILNFSPTIPEYSFNLHEDETKVMIDAIQEDKDSYVSGLGTFEVPTGSTDYEIAVTSTDGNIKIYTVTLNRSSSTNPFLKGLKINGVLYEQFKEDTFEYKITLPYHLDIALIEAIKSNDKQAVTGDGIHILTNSESIAEILVISENGENNKLYKIHFEKEKTTLLKEITLQEILKTIKLEPNKFIYDVDISSLIHSLSLNIVPYYNGVNINIEGNKYIGEKNKTIKITSSLEGLEDSVYTLNFNLLKQETKEVFNYAYSGKPQTFTAPVTAYYNIELWGAMGTGAAYGGYTKGKIFLAKDTKLYIYVGQQTQKSANATGFNSGTGNSQGYSGGGATDVRLVMNENWQNFDSLKSRIMVAGGGGSATTGTPGAAGGLIGYPGGSGVKGGTQTSGGIGNPASRNGQFGYAYGGTAGGNGYYAGGGAGFVTGSGGGSSFISGHDGSNAILETSTVAKIVHSDQSIHYSDYKFIDTVMIDGKGYEWTNIKTNLTLMPKPNGGFFATGTGNNSNGYARISTADLLSNDNYLDSIIVKSGDDIINLNPSFETTEQEYSINLTKNQSNINVVAIPKDILATVTGIGNLDIAPGLSDIEISVTAQDGSIRTYVIHVNREADNDPYPINIAVNRLPNYLCKMNTSYCQYGFVKTVTEYNIELPYAIKEVELAPTLKSKWQTINYYIEYDFIDTTNNTPIDTNGIFSLDNELTTIYIEVISEDGVSNVVYTYNFKRDVTGNNNLESIKITNPDIVIDNFEKYKYEYYITLPTGFSFDIEAIPERKENTKVEIQNNVLTTEPYTTTVSGLHQGLNNVIITVTAENGDTKTYILHVYKGYESDVLLNELIVKNGNNNLELTPLFDNRINDYSLSVGSDVNSIDIKALARDVSGTEITGAGTKTLKSGINNFQVVVKSKTLNTNGEYDTNTYNITVYKDMSNNATISNITIDNHKLNPIYDEDIHEYYINLNANESSVNVNVVMADENATYTIRGNNNLNKAINEIIVTGIAEDKTYVVYKIYAYKSISNNNDLVSLNYKIADDFISVPDFHKDKLTYTLNVAGNIRKIEFEAINEDDKAIVNGTGVYYLKVGTNTITINVISESGLVKTYTIEVFKAFDNDTSLLDVTNNRGSEVIKQSTSDYDYLINVQYEVNSIEIKGIANSNLAVVSGNGTYNLVPGNNDISLRVTAEDKSYKDYVVRVVRDLSNNDDLSFLYVKEGGLVPNFNETTIYYEVKVPNEIDNLEKIHIEALPENSNANVVINNTGGPLEVGVAREVTVVVTAPNNTDIKTYTINILRQNSTVENLSLETLTTNKGELSPTFSPDTLNYTLEVENDVTDIEIMGTAFSDTVKIEGLGNQQLKVGKNLFAVFVIGEGEVQRDYQIVVTRKKSNDATLSNLVVKGHILTPIFNKETTSYSLNTSKDYLEFTTIKPTELEATYKIEGNTSFKTGNNEVKIVVTAPDTETTKEYVINVVKSGSKNNNLASLNVEDYELVPTFHKGVTFYAVDVASNINSVMIKATAEDSTAIINGTGLHSIQTGENYFDIVVTSEDATNKTYTILVTKDASDNNYLANLEVNEGFLDRLFVKTENNYEVVVPYDIAEIEIYGTKEDAGASVVGFGIYKLNEGTNDFEITVTSESGKTNIYSIKVIRESVKSAYLTSLSVENFVLDPEFNKEIFEYYITVPNEITSLNLNYDTEDKEAIATVLGNANFNIGMNEVIINVTRAVSETETLEQDYIIYVNRQMSTNNYLATLSLSNGTLSPLFAKEESNYTVTVPNNVSEIVVYATTEDNTSRITIGTGKHALEPGLNIILVKVRSSIGVTRTYKLEVTREKSNNSKLKNLIVKNVAGEELNSNEIFNSNLNTYQYDLATTLEYVIITAVKDEKYQVVAGEGIKTLTKGINNFDVTVTAQDGSINTYTLIINNPLSSNNYLTSLKPSSGALLPDFDKNTFNYSLDIDNASNLSFEAIPEINTSIVTGHEIKPVEEGTSVRVITVTAEDGTTREYTINVTKPIHSNALLENLEIDKYPMEFDSNTFTYNIQVSNSKKVLLESEIRAIPKDSGATVNMMGDLDLTLGIVNIYTIEVIAKDGYTTQEYTLNITRDSEEYTIRSNVYEIVRYDSDTEEDYVIGIGPSTIISDFKNNFDNEPEDLKIYLDTEEVGETDLTATALILKLEKNGNVYDRLRVIVRGDLTNDGKVNITDQVKMINYVGRTTTLDKYQMLAGDLTFDGKVNITDQVKIINYVGRTISDINDKPKS